MQIQDTHEKNQKLKHHYKLKIKKKKQRKYFNRHETRSFNLSNMTKVMYMIFNILNLYNNKKSNLLDLQC